jgi:hypothetical protein
MLTINKSSGSADDCTSYFTRPLSVPQSEFPKKHRNGLRVTV